MCHSNGDRAVEETGVVKILPGCQKSLSEDVTFPRGPRKESQPCTMRGAFQYVSREKPGHV